MILSENRSFSGSCSCLLDLDQGAAEILGVQEQHRLAVGADLRLAVAEHARALGLEPVARRDDVVDLVADVVNAAVGIALEKFRDRRASPSGSSSSILVLGSVMKTVVTPWSGCGTGSETSAPSVSR